MRIGIAILCGFFLFVTATVARPADQAVTARLLVSNPTPYVGEELDLILEITHNPHPGGRTLFTWPLLDDFIAADRASIRTQSGRDAKNRLIESVSRRIRPLRAGPLSLNGATVRAGEQTIDLQPLTLRVQPLPNRGKPVGFENQIGNYRLLLAAAGAGPRQVSLHIYDSNQLAPAPNVRPWTASGGQLALLATTTRQAGGNGREHILNYYYHPADGKKGALRFTLPIFDPQLQAYRIISTAPSPAATIFPVFRLAALALLTVMACWGSIRWHRHPRTIEGCLQKLCLRPVRGLSRQNIEALLQTRLDQESRNELNRYWRNEDAIRYGQRQSFNRDASRQTTKRLRQSLWKAIDKRRDIP